MHTIAKRGGYLDHFQCEGAPLGRVYASWQQPKEDIISAKI
jgi:hypothetical protein